MAATENKLGELHDKVADVLISALDRNEAQQRALMRRAEEQAQDNNEDEEDVVVFIPEINPALLSVATKFLKDNDITCQPNVGNRADELRKKLEKKRKSVNNVTHLSDIV